MKKISKIIFALIIVFGVFSCSQEEIVQEKPLDLTNMDLSKMNIDIDFSKSKFDLSKDMSILLKDFSDYIYDNNIKVNQKINSFRIRKVDNELLINYPQNSSKSNFQARKAPCPSHSITCRSAAAVRSALARIIGDGSRDVNISYVRHTLKVVITYAYQDC